MKKVTIVLTLLLLGTAYGSKAQWTMIGSARGNFSFSMPSYPSVYDTLEVLAYMLMPDASNISYHVEFVDHAYISGNEELQRLLANRSGAPAPAAVPCYVDSIENLLNTYAQMFQYHTQGTIEGFVTSNYTPCSIYGRELTVRHQNFEDGNWYFTFTRYYYYNSRFLIFTVSGPEANLSALYAYKNQFFGSIAIY